MLHLNHPQNQPNRTDADAVNFKTEGTNITSYYISSIKAKSMANSICCYK
jgi:hypothetical protein